MNLFEYNRRDDSGYIRTMEVRASTYTRNLILDTDPHGHSPSCVLPREEVVKLYDVLGQWLGESLPESGTGSAPAPVTFPDMGRALDKLRNEVLERVDQERGAWVKAVSQLQGQITDLRANLRNAAEGLGEGL